MTKLTKLAFEDKTLKAAKEHVELAYEKYKVLSESGNAGYAEKARLALLDGVANYISVLNAGADDLLKEDAQEVIDEVNKWMSIVGELHDVDTTFEDEDLADDERMAIREGLDEIEEEDAAKKLEEMKQEEMKARIEKTHEVARKILKRTEDIAKGEYDKPHAYNADWNKIREVAKQRARDGEYLGRKEVGFLTHNDSDWLDYIDEVGGYLWWCGKCKSMNGPNRSCEHGPNDDDFDKKHSMDEEVKMYEHELGSEYDEHREKFVGATIKLYKLATEMDYSGLYAEADELDKAIKQMAERAGLKLQDMVALANELDTSGYVEAADAVDYVIKNANMGNMFLHFPLIEALDNGNLSGVKKAIDDIVSGGYKVHEELGIDENKYTKLMDAIEKNDLALVREILGVAAPEPTCPGCFAKLKMRYLYNNPETGPAALRCPNDCQAAELCSICGHFMHSKQCDKCECKSSFEMMAV